MGNHQGGLAQFPVGALEHTEHRVGVLGVQIPSRLVGQHDGRARDEGAGDGHPLLLTAAQLRGPMLEPPADRQHLTEMVEISPVERLLASADRIGNLDVSHCRERGQQVELLENKADAVLAELGALSIAERGKIDSVNDDAAAGGLGQPAEQVKKCGFT